MNCQPVNHYYATIWVRDLHWTRQLTEYKRALNSIQSKSFVDMCGVEGKRRTLWSKRHKFAPTSRHKT